MARNRTPARLLLLTLGLFAATVRSSLAADPPPAPKSSSNSLEQRIEAELRTPGYERGHWGVLVVDAKTGRSIYERNADEFFAPASVTKLFTVASALAELGPNHRFQTPVVRRGEIDSGGVLRGDLILIARGDLCLGGRTGPDGTLLFHDDDHTYAGSGFKGGVVSTDPLAGLDHLAREIQAVGIKHVTGDVLIDDRLFRAEPTTGSGPSRVSPIVINDNLIDVFATPGAHAGEPGQVELRPPTRFFSIDPQVETIEAGETPRLSVEEVGLRRLVVRGKLPVGHAKALRSHEVEEPAAFARALFIESLRKRGVVVDASPLGVNNFAGLPPSDQLAKLAKVAEYTSPPFREFVRVILKVSHNLHASTLPLLIAAKYGERTLEDGLRRQGKQLQELGVDPGSVSFGGGAGGSRADFVTPRATVSLLRTMLTRPDFPAFDVALPILGRDGTLAKAVGPESPARGHARAKTGTYWVENELTGKTLLTSKALAGYLDTASGRSLVFAFFVNNILLDAPRSGYSTADATAEAGRLMGRLCEVFYGSDPDTSAPRSPKRSIGGGGQ
ncbi:MAG: D-alanyl-D-alanine carboxypeptidase/D-alanyl-D-alanine-endopeptidase [Planctomycetes bacterium SCN 63-9]|nr:MAG: D-alanyl-D-alanine carboxypeptidase/D-alanyl-D-alanine-endopeptidase [Planctomycetes bacterium SCN 63-9]